MELNQAGIDLVKHFESCKLKAYPDPGTGGEPWTIGYGATGPGIEPGVVWTQDEAEKRLMQDLSDTAIRITPLLGNCELNDNQFSALVSFAFNCGVHNLAHSTLLQKVVSGDLMGAANEFPKWNKAAGHVLDGLTARREAERKLFMEAGESV